MTITRTSNKTVYSFFEQRLYFRSHIILCFFSQTETSTYVLQTDIMVQKTNQTLGGIDLRRILIISTGTALSFSLILIIMYEIYTYQKMSSSNDVVWIYANELKRNVQFFWTCIYQIWVYICMIQFVHCVLLTTLLGFLIVFIFYDTYSLGLADHNHPWYPKVVHNRLFDSSLMYL